MICDLPGNADPRSKCCWNCKRKVMCFRGRVRTHWIRSCIGATTFFFIEFYDGMYNGTSPPVFAFLEPFLINSHFSPQGPQTPCSGIPPYIVTLFQIAERLHPYFGSYHILYISFLGSQGLTSLIYGHRTVKNSLVFLAHPVHMIPNLLNVCFTYW